MFGRYPVPSGLKHGRWQQSGAQTLRDKYGRCGQPRCAAEEPGVSEVKETGTTLVPLTFHAPLGHRASRRGWWITEARFSIVKEFT